MTQARGTATCEESREEGGEMVVRSSSLKRRGSGLRTVGCRGGGSANEVVQPGP